MKIRNVVVYLLAFVLICICFTLIVKKEHIDLLLNVSFIGILGACVVGLLNYAISGLLYYYQVKSAYNIRLSAPDVLFMPVAMNLWSYIIPFQGGLLYSMSFFKLKYKIALSGSFALTLYTYMISLFFTGLIGILFSVYSGNYSSGLFWVSLVFLLNPFLTFIAEFFLKRFSFGKIKILDRSKIFFLNLLQSLKSLLADRKTTVIVMLLNMLHIGATILWFYVSAKSLHLEISIIMVTLLALLMRVSLIFRITPGNLGIEQLVSGGIAAAIGAAASEGIVISLYMTVITIILISTVGLTSTMSNFKYFKAKNLSEFFNNLKAKKEN